MQSKKANKKKQKNKKKTKKKNAPWRFWLDCVNAQADLNLRWAQISEGTLSDTAAHMNIARYFSHLVIHLFGNSKIWCLLKEAPLQVCVCVCVGCLLKDALLQVCVCVCGGGGGGRAGGGGTYVGVVHIAYG